MGTAGYLNTKGFSADVAIRVLPTTYKAIRNAHIQLYGISRSFPTHLLVQNVYKISQLYIFWIFRERIREIKKELREEPVIFLG